MKAVTSPAGVLLVANQGDADLSIVDPRSAKQVARVAEGGATGHEVAVSLDGKAREIAMAAAKKRARLFWKQPITYWRRLASQL
jgi:hypothetical protein